MHPVRKRFFNRIFVAGIVVCLGVLALSPFLESGKKNDTDYNRVIIEYTISKDFYSSQGRSFVDAENLEHFLKSAKEGTNSSAVMPASDPYEMSTIADRADSN